MLKIAVVITILVCAQADADACKDPVSYGAVPNDGISDRAAIQAAIDADPSGVVCLGLGRWTVERAPVGSRNRFAAISTWHGTTIAGSGPATVLELAGDQGGGGVSVISIDPGAWGATVRDLTIDTSLATNTDEQTHAIQIGSGICPSALLGGCRPVLDTRLERVTFLHPGSSLARKGDCVRLLGNELSSQVRRVSMVGGMFSVCARSGISIQRNVHELSIVANLFQSATDQDIDSEPTGGSTYVSNSDIVISGNTFAMSDRASAQGDHAVTIGGSGAPMSRVTVTGNVFDGRGIRLYRTADVVITGNAIRLDAAIPGSGVVEIGGTADAVIVASNSIRRSGAAGPVIKAWPQSGEFPGPIAISGNLIAQGTDAYAVYLESADGAIVADNRIGYSSPANLQTAIGFRATARDTAGIKVSGNVIGPGPGYAVRLHASPYRIDNAQVSGNTSVAPTGLVCSPTGAIGPVVIGGNAMGPHQCPMVTGGD